MAGAEVLLTEEGGEDPFRVPIERFRTLSDDEKAALVRRADRIARDRVDLELEARKAAWLVLVGDDVVLASADPQAIPSAEEVLRLGEPTGLVAYLFEAPLIEEVPVPRTLMDLLLSMPDVGDDAVFERPAEYLVRLVIDPTRRDSGSSGSA